MKKITLKVPENKMKFFMELIEQLGIEVASEIAIPEEHKAIVRERINSAKPEEMVSWKEGRRRLTFKDKP